MIRIKDEALTTRDDVITLYQLATIFKMIVKVDVNQRVIKIPLRKCPNIIEKPKAVRR